MIKARLIAVTKPTEEFSKETDMSSVQDLIAYCARVSNPTNQLNKETNEKLLNYLAKHKHWSPFELADAVLELKVPRDIGRQILRHRTCVFQEFSQRYADPAAQENQFILRDARLQDDKNRQNSILISDLSLINEWYERQQQVIDLAREQYDWAINNGLAKECARVVLPEGNTMSTMYMKGSIRTWMHYIEVRSGNGTQQEHIDIALACAKAISEVFPLIDEYVTK
jgi:thymidylate synthase (FAD)